jgi:hypothetical protein
MCSSPFCPPLHRRSPSGSNRHPLRLRDDEDRRRERGVLVTSFYYFCGHEQWHPEELVRHAVVAEEAGFDGVVVSEHFHPWVDDHSAAGFAFSTIGAMAQATERIRIVTGVTTPLFRFHPAIVAQAAATLDRLSNGRFDLGVGTGENINEGPLGYDFPAYKERAAGCVKRSRSCDASSTGRSSPSTASSTAPTGPSYTAPRPAMCRS